MRVCLNQSCFPGLTMQQFVEVVAWAGGVSAELRPVGRDAPARDVAAAVRATGLRIEAVNALMDWALPDDPDPRPNLEPLLEVATATGAPLIVCVAPLRAGALPPAAQIAQSASARLAELSALTRQAGVRLSLEQVGRSTTRLGTKSGIRRLSEALAIAKAAGEDVCLALDSYNLATAGETFAKVRTVPPERIAITQVVDRDTVTGTRTLPGEGDLDIDAFVQALTETGYDGALSLEIFPQEPWPDPVGFARDALARMRRAMRQDTGVHP